MTYTSHLCFIESVRCWHQYDVNKKKSAKECG